MRFTAAAATDATVVAAAASAFCGRRTIPRHGSSSGGTWGKTEKKIQGKCP